MIEATSATVRNRTSASWRSFDMCYPDLRWAAPARRRLPLRRNCTQVQEATLGAVVTGGEVNDRTNRGGATRHADGTPVDLARGGLKAPAGAGRAGRG